MLISRTPFRVSLFGGGTDYPVWYREHGGSVISLTIDKYCYLTLRYLPPFFDYKYRLRYFKREEVNKIEQIEHNSIKACLKFLNEKKGIDLVHHADLPAQSGLGSSSTFTVSMLHALHTLQNFKPSKYQLALEAIKIEQDEIGESVGSQDQTAAAYGGFNKIEFGGPQEVKVSELTIDSTRLKYLEDRLVLFFTGLSRDAGVIAADQIKNTKNKKKELEHMSLILKEAEDIIQNPYGDLDEIGKLLNKQWEIKRNISNKISNEKIDNLYKIGILSGAKGGKLLGAGGGGFLLFYVDPIYKENLITKLSHLLHVPFSFDFTFSIPFLDPPLY